MPRAPAPVPSDPDTPVSSEPVPVEDAPDEEGQGGGYDETSLTAGDFDDNLNFQYFLEYNECMSNDFTMCEGGSKLELKNSDIHDWRITFVDTGINSNIGQRFLRVKKYLADEEVFLANYSDGLTNMNLEKQLEHFRSCDKIAGFLSVKPNLSYHAVTSLKNNDLVAGMKPFKSCNIRINGGFFIFKNDIFKFIKEGEELVLEPFYRLIEKEQLISYEYDGFWAAMDTFKDKQVLDELYDKGDPPWQLWTSNNKKKNYRPNGYITKT